MKVGDKKQNYHKHSELIIFSNKQDFSRSENKRENKLDKEQEWIGKRIWEPLGDVAFSLSLASMPYLQLAVGKREANWAKLPPEVLLLEVEGQGPWPKHGKLSEAIGIELIPNKVEQILA